eukprot:359405-Chlamydomonas_euryale.AAC.1
MGGSSPRDGGGVKKGGKRMLRDHLVDAQQSAVGTMELQEERRVKEAGRKGRNRRASPPSAADDYSAGLEVRGFGRQGEAGVCGGGGQEGKERVRNFHNGSGSSASGCSTIRQCRLGNVRVLKRQLRVTGMTCSVPACVERVWKWLGKSVGREQEGIPCPLWHTYVKFGAQTRELEAADGAPSPSSPNHSSVDLHTSRKNNTAVGSVKAHPQCANGGTPTRSVPAAAGYRLLPAE